MEFIISAKDYYYLTKPGIIRGNAITATGGFLLASKGVFDIYLFIYMLIGLSLVIASACVLNNYLDQDIDKIMARTKNRALVTGNVSSQSAIIFSVICGTLGFGLLGYFTNKLTFLTALFGFITYVIIYGRYKRSSVHGTVIGSLSGAAPPVVGYTAVTNNIDIAAVLLFLILIFWQMPHFYAIAIYRLKDYTNAKIPVLPIQGGILRTKVQMLIYINAFIVASTMLTVFGYTGYVYGVLMILLGSGWFWLGLKGFGEDINNQKWAKKMFLYSLIVMTAFSILISATVYLP